MQRSFPKAHALRCALTACVLACGGVAQAASFTLSGNFVQDDNIAWIPLQLDTADLVNVLSIGYAGGTDTLSQAWAAGGFDTMAFLYDANGVLIAQSDDGVNALIDPVTGLAADAGFSIQLQPGTYQLALTQYDNFALGDLADGFSQAGSGNFTPTLSPNCTANAFCDWSGAARSSQWVLTIDGVSAVPEPGSLLLMAVGVVGLLGLRRRLPQA